MNYKSLIVFTTLITACLAQKGGSFGKTLSNENRSPARQIQQQKIFQQAALAPSQPSSFQPAPVQSAPFKPAPAQPASFQPAPVQQVSFQPAPAQPAPFKPATVQQVSFQPAPAQPSSFQPAPVQQVSFQPAPAQPASFQPAPVKQSPFQPVPSQPAAFQPASFQPAPVQQTSVPSQPSFQPFQPSSVQQYEDDEAAVAGPTRQRPQSPQAALAGPVRESDDFEQHPAPEPYTFSYAVTDDQFGSEVSREESQDALGNIVGFYLMRDAEGRARRVDYTAGPEGFRAVIRSNEEGLANKDSADAKYEVDEVPADRQNAAALAAQSRAKAAGFGQPSSSPADSFGSGAGSPFSDEAALAAAERQRVQPQSGKGFPKEPSKFVSPAQQRPQFSQPALQQQQPQFSQPAVQQPQLIQSVPSSSFFPSRPSDSAALAEAAQAAIQSIFNEPLIHSPYAPHSSSSFPSTETPTDTFDRVQPETYESINPFDSYSPSDDDNDDQEQEEPEPEEEQPQQQFIGRKSKRWALPLNFFLPGEYRS